MSVDLGQAPFQRFEIRVTSSVSYWTVVDERFEPVGVADDYLRDLRFGRDRATGSTATYASGLSLFLNWCSATGRSFEQAATDLSRFVVYLRTTPIERGRGKGSPRGAERINGILAAVREIYKHAVVRGVCTSEVLRTLYSESDDRHLPPELKQEGARIRHRQSPRHRLQTEERLTRPVTLEEFDALLEAATSWRDRFLLVVLLFCGLRSGEALGLRRSDMHLAPSSTKPGVHGRRPASPRRAAREHESSEREVVPPKSCPSPPLRLGFLRAVSRRAVDGACR